MSRILCGRVPSVRQSAKERLSATAPVIFISKATRGSLVSLTYQ